MKLDHNLFAKMLIDFLRPTPTKVIHNNEHTIILFDDGSKTVTKPNGDKYDPYIGFCVAMTAKYFGGKKAAHQAYESLSGCKYGTQPDEYLCETCAYYKNADYQGTVFETYFCTNWNTGCKGSTWFEHNPNQPCEYYSNVNYNKQKAKEGTI